MSGCDKSTFERKETGEIINRGTHPDVEKQRERQPDRQKRQTDTDRRTQSHTGERSGHTETDRHETDTEKIQNLQTGHVRYTEKIHNL